MSISSIWAAIATILIMIVGSARNACAGAEMESTVYVISPIVDAQYDNQGQSARDDEILYGMQGTLESAIDGTCSVRMDYGYRVRVNTCDLLTWDRVPETWRRESTHVIEAPFADVVPVPDIRAFPARMVLPRGARLWVTGEEGDYSRVVLHDGETGYVRNSLIRKVTRWEDNNETVNRARVRADALSYLGVQYRWGGKTPFGIDCSGLASMAYLLNGLAIYRNSRPLSGYPVALQYVEDPKDGYSRESLANAKPGDLIYWKDHQGIYIGEGKYIHANTDTFTVHINSLLKDDADFRENLAVPGALLVWGTPYPEKPECLTVRRFIAVPTDGKGEYRFFARLDGYAPTSAILFPEGEGEGKPAIVIDTPGEMVYGAIDATNMQAPAYCYEKPGIYYPAIVFSNMEGWRPRGQAISSGVAVLESPITVR